MAHAEHRRCSRCGTVYAFDLERLRRVDAQPDEGNAAACRCGGWVYVKVVRGVAKR